MNRTKAGPLIRAAGLPLRGLCLVLLAARLSAAAAAGPAPASVPFRPPAVPLVAHDPYFSIWSPADHLADADTTHWTGKPHRLTSRVRIDGRTFRLLGRDPGNLPALPQTGVEVLPTRTLARFEGAGVSLVLTFLSPALPDDLDLASRPVTYVTWTVQSTDRESHRVEIQFDAAPELAVNEPRQNVTWANVSTERLEILQAGSETQAVLARKGDDLRIDWGHLYLAAPKAAGTTARMLPAAVARESFAAGAEPPLIKMASRQTAGEAPVLVLTFDLGPVGNAPASRWLMLAYDDERSIRYFRQDLRPYWRRDGSDAIALLEGAGTEHPAIARRAEAFDAELMADLRRVGGEPYAELGALAYRQTFAGNKICADDAGQPLMFPKENFSNGCIGTVDVLFPQGPFFLLFSPALTKAMLVPVLDYAASPRWPYAYAPHDLGTYPHATGQVYGMGGTDGDRMPVEESGNVLILLAALARDEGNAEFSRPYLPMLARWADYLVANGLDPTNQLCSADMFGHLPRNANLALKAVLGIGAFAQLGEWAGQPETARRYGTIARDYAARWQALAGAGDHTLLAYGQPGTWSQKHNLIWDHILDTRLIPDAVADAEVAWYLRVQKAYGLPVDNRTDTSLLDWALWSISLARRPADFEALLAPLHRYAHETPSRVPLSDWFTTTDAKQKGFQARPVVGGVFMRLLADPDARAKWTKRGANTRGPWTPIALGKPVKEIVPTAQTGPAAWRFTFAAPAADWTTPAFDDRAWPQGPGGFGTRGTPGASIGTEWKTERIWLRRAFELPDRPLRNPKLRLIYDEDPEIYLNGVLAAKGQGWITQYEEIDIAPAALATLKPGRNVLSVHARQTYGGQCIDVGLVEEPQP